MEIEVKDNDIFWSAFHSNFVENILYSFLKYWYPSLNLYFVRDVKSGAYSKYELDVDFEGLSLETLVEVDKSVKRLFKKINSFRISHPYCIEGRVLENSQVRYSLQP